MANKAYFWNFFELKKIISKQESPLKQSWKADVLMVSCIWIFCQEDKLRGVVEKNGYFTTPKSVVLNIDSESEFLIKSNNYVFRNTWFCPPCGWDMQSASLSSPLFLTHSHICMHLYSDVDEDDLLMIFDGGSAGTCSSLLKEPPHW